MKKLLFLYCSIFFIIAFNIQTVQAQCTCTPAQSVTGSSSELNVGNNQTRCITGGTQTGNINLGSSSTLCVLSGATISSTGSINSNSNVTIYNYGTWNRSFNFQNNNTFYNYGTFTVGSLSVSNNSEFYNYANATITGSLNINNGTEFHYIGNGTSNLTIGGSVTIDGLLNVENGDVSIGGSVNVNSNGNIDVSSGTITIQGNLVNNGRINGGTSAVDCGGIEVLGSSIQNSSGKYGVTQGNQNTYVDICDKSSAGGGGFDTANGTFGSNVTNCACTGVALSTIISNFKTTYYSKNKTVKITWITADLAHFKKFIIERSGDGIHFSVIGEIEAAPKDSYEYDDYMPLSGLNYYKIKAETNEGTNYTTSILVEKVETHTTKPYLITHPQITNTFHLANISNVQVEWYNSVGKLILAQQVINETTPLDTSNLPAGCYILKVITASTVHSIKIVLNP